jgi:hypothetical protein
LNFLRSPDCLPAAASRRIRVWVARGNIPYSAVTQPSPVFFRNGGTRSSSEARRAQDLRRAAFDQAGALGMFRRTDLDGNFADFV